MRNLCKLAQDLNAQKKRQNGNDPMKLVMTTSGVQHQFIAFYNCSTGTNFFRATGSLYISPFSLVISSTLFT